MTFTTPLALLLLILLPLFAVIGWPRVPFRRRRDTFSLLLRLLIVALLVLGVSGAQMVRAAEKLAVVFLVDHSQSMDSAARAEAFDYVCEAMRHAAREDQAAIVLFGADALVERPMLPIPNLTECAAFTSTPNELNTDLAEAIQLGLALYPADAARRMVILSDGAANSGDALEAARLAAAAGVQVDYVPFHSQQLPEIRLTSVDVPTRLSVDEPFEVTYTIESDRDTRVAVTLLASGQTVDRTEVEVRRGENTFIFPLAQGFAQTGFSDIRIVVEPLETGSDAFFENNQLSAFTEITGPARILMVAQAGEQGQLDTAHLLPALLDVGLEVDLITPDRLPTGLAPLSGYASVVMVNVPAAQVSQRRMTVLDTYVRDLGGGFVFIGGDRSYGVGGYFRTPIEDLLPVEMQLRDQERVPALTLIFVIDTSGSMSAVGPSGFSNLELAKEAIIRSIELLNPVDRLGVVSFESLAAWIVDITTVDNPGALQAQVATLRSGGGTDILAGINAAATALAEDPSQFRHVILLTDGGANPQGIPELVQRMHEQMDTTTSVVAIGDGFAPFLTDIAQIGGGNFHFARDVQSIPTIFTAETVLATRSYINETEFVPVLTGQSPILDGIRSAPALRGYIATTGKDTAQVLWRSPEPESDPVLAAWQYGLGRSVAWTSDAADRWASNYVTWEGYPRLFSQMVRWTITEGVNSNLETRVESSAGQTTLVVDARDDAGAFLNGLTLEARVTGPDGAAQDVTLFQVAPGRYEAALEPQQEGAYFIRVTGDGVGTADLVQSPTVAQTSGWVLSYSPEFVLPEGGLNLELLSDVANLTGGTSLVERVEEVFSHDLSAQHASVPLWPWLLLAAALLLLFDIGVRRLIITRTDWLKLRLWLLEALGIGTRQRAAQTTGEVRMERLAGAKRRATQEMLRLTLEQPPPDAVQSVLGTDERKQPQPSRPQPERPEPVTSSAQTAASLAASKRRRAAREDSAPEDTPQQEAPPARPAPGPERPHRQIETPASRQPRQGSSGNLASRLLKTRQEDGEDAGDEANDS